MNRSRMITVAAIIVALCAVVAWLLVRGMWSSIQLSFADEQTEIFSEMVGKASESLRQEPPAVQDAVGFLNYTHNYYPSGTKQTTGSRLDRIVERSRSLAELRIIQMLRDATKTDLGTDADDWIRKFGDQPVSHK